MASILIATVPVHGHVTPLLPVARHLVARGDRVRFLTGSRFGETVAATGAEHVPLPAEAEFDDRMDLAETFPERVGLSGAKAIAFDIEHVFIQPGRAQHDAVMALHEQEPADALLADPAFVGAGFVAGHPRGSRPAVLVCGVVPLTIASRDTAPYGMGLPPLGGPVGRARNALLGTLAARTVFPAAQRLADDIHQAVLGRPLTYPILDWPRHAEALAQFTVPEFEYPRSDAPTTLQFVGPIMSTGAQAPLPPWWPEVDGSRPVVHVTQGTIANRDHRQVTAPALEGLADEDVLVVVSTGGRPLDTLPPLPPNARAAEYLPYEHLLPRTDVFVTNGGYGGVQYALRHGVPVVTSGGKEDKPEVGARVAWSGAGVRLKSETPSAASVRAAVRRVLDAPRYRARARALADTMERAGGVRQLADIIDALTPQDSPSSRHTDLTGQGATPLSPPSGGDASQRRPFGQ